MFIGAHHNVNSVLVLGKYSFPILYRTNSSTPSNRFSWDIGVSNCNESLGILADLIIIWEQGSPSFVPNFAKIANVPRQKKIDLDKTQLICIY